jgi:hypothetical protein
MSKAPLCGWNGEPSANSAANGLVSIRHLESVIEVEHISMECSVS